MLTAGITATTVQVNTTWVCLLTTDLVEQVGAVCAKGKIF